MIRSRPARLPADVGPAPLPAGPARRRLWRTALYETGGLVLTYVVCLWIGQTGPGQAGLLAGALVGAGYLWTLLHDIVFDHLQRSTPPLGSARYHRLRLRHAISLEVSSSLAIVPPLMLIGGCTLLEALAADLLLSILSFGYTYLFYWGYDLALMAGAFSTDGPTRPRAVSRLALPSCPVQARTIHGALRALATRRLTEEPSRALAGRVQPAR